MPWSDARGIADTLLLFLLLCMMCQVIFDDITNIILLYFIA